MKNKTEKFYHIGFAIRGKTLIIQARRSIDYLSCEIYDYMGKRVITKQELYNNRYKILEAAKVNRPGVYSKLKYAVVD